MPDIPFTEEQKRRAASVDLEEYLPLHGEALLPSGRDKRLTSDHSITVQGNVWYDHAARRGGGPISFMQKFYHLSYPEAVTRLWTTGRSLPHSQSNSGRNSRAGPSPCLPSTRICGGCTRIC